MPAQPGQKPPILVYLGILLQKGKLNATESTELTRCVPCGSVCVRVYGVCVCCVCMGVCVCVDVCV